MPSYQSIRRESGLPEQARFHGWSILRTDTEEFVAKSQIKKDYNLVGYNKRPELALRWRSAKLALAFTKAIDHPFALAVIFDLEDRYPVVLIPIEE
uniref:hypothetical protein n=1 Tax=uncultured Erythrobacter sp. TaxID=263913 RepID=UPI002639F6FB|nr:hypothetical protein [uncultured Erythrobacter sp.]